MTTHPEGRSGRNVYHAHRTVCHTRRNVYHARFTCELGPVRSLGQPCVQPARQGPEAGSRNFLASITAHPPGNAPLFNCGHITVFSSHLRDCVALVCEENAPNLNFSVSKVITDSIVLSTDPRTFPSQQRSQRSPPDHPTSKARAPWKGGCKAAVTEHPLPKSKGATGRPRLRRTHSSSAAWFERHRSS